MDNFKYNRRGIIFGGGMILIGLFLCLVIASIYCFNFDKLFQFSGSYYAPIRWWTNK